MKKIIISLSVSTVLFLVVGCYSSKMTDSYKTKIDNWTPISEEPTTSSIIDGIWQIDACYTKDNGIIQGIKNDPSGRYLSRGVTTQDSNIIFDRKYIFASFHKGNMNIYAMDTDSNCAIKGIYNLSDSTKTVKYLYTPLATEIRFYTFKFDYDFVKKHFLLNRHNANNGPCVSPKDYSATFSVILEDTNTYVLEKDVLIFRYEKPTGEIINEVVLKRLK